MLSMQCKNVRKELDRFVDGDLGEPSRSSLKRHLRECSGCLLEYQKTVRLVTAMAQLRPVRAHEDFAHGVLTRLSSFKRDSRRRLSMAASMEITAAMAMIAATLCYTNWAVRSSSISDSNRRLDPVPVTVRGPASLPVADALAATAVESAKDPAVEKNAGALGKGPTEGDQQIPGSNPGLMTIEK